MTSESMVNRVNRVSGDLPVAVLGAGPVGLAAAAHLAERGIGFVVLEAGAEVGAAVREWGQVRVFSPWRLNVDAVAARLLDASGWQSPDLDGLPTGDELVEEYLAPLAKLQQIAPSVRFGYRVSGIGRVGVDRMRTANREDAPFVIRAMTSEGVVQVLARAVIDATGTWRTPNVLGASGLVALGEQEAAEFISSALPDVLGADREAFAGRRTLVVGAGHSAANTLMALAELAAQEPGTEVVWAIRGTGSVGASRTFGGGDADALPARGALSTRVRTLVESGRIELLAGFEVEAVRVDGSQVEVAAIDGHTVRIDRIVSATGFRPDHTIASELRLDLDPILESTRALAPLIDPNVHSCGTVPPHGEAELRHPEQGYYAVGMKSYGRAPTFLMATGYEQVRSVVAHLAGDVEAAQQVSLELPETGVCSSNAGPHTDEGSPVGVTGGLLPLVSSGSGCCG